MSSLREGKRWLPIEDELLRLLHERHTSLEECALQLCRSKVAIIGRKQRLGLTRLLRDDLYHNRIRKKKKK